MSENEYQEFLERIKHEAIDIETLADADSPSGSTVPVAKGGALRKVAYDSLAPGAISDSDIDAICGVDVAVESNEPVVADGAISVSEPVVEERRAADVVTVTNAKKASIVDLGESGR